MDRVEGNAISWLIHKMRRLNAETLQEENRVTDSLPKDPVARVRAHRMFRYLATGINGSGILLCRNDCYFGEAWQRAI